MTIREIAKLAGTSRGTVDRVLNNRGNVSPELAQRILEIAKDTDYRFNPFARALANGKKRSRIGAVINAEGNPFFDDVLAGIDDTVEKYSEYGLEMEIRKIKGYDEAAQLRALDEVVASGVDALAVTPIDSPQIHERLAALTALPIVLLNADLRLDNKLAFIGCDYFNSGCLSGDIAGLSLPGGGRVAIVTGSFKMLGHNERIRGFRQTVSANPAIEIAAVQENNDDDGLSYRVTSQLLRETRPDLIYFCAAGTEGGVRAVKEAGAGTRVIVVDDIQPMRAFLSEGAIQAIVTQQPYRQGSTMVEILYEKLIRGADPDHIYHYMDNQVKLRNSK